MPNRGIKWGFECFGRFFCKFRQFNFQHEVGMERNCRYQVEVLSVGGDTLLMIFSDMM